MRYKMRCPHENCGRCIGEFTCSDEDNSIAKVHKAKPTSIGDKTFVYSRKCPKCKNEIYIEMGFKDN